MILFMFHYFHISAYYWAPYPTATKIMISFAERHRKKGKNCK